MDPDDQAATDVALTLGEAIDQVRLRGEWGQLPDLVAELHADRNAWIDKAQAAYEREDVANRRWLDARAELDEVRAGAERVWAFANWVAGLNGPNVRDRQHLTLDQVIAWAAFVIERQKEEE